MKACVLHSEKRCNHCGECDDRCQINPSKVCDNCFQCLDAVEGMEYAKIGISRVLPDQNDYLFADEDLHPVIYSGNLLVSTLLGCRGKRRK